MKTIYETFEFDIIKNRLREHAITEIGKNYVDRLEMYQNKGDLIDSLEELKEGIKYCYKYSKLNIHYHPNLINPLNNIRKGGIGNKEFFYQLSYLLENISLIKQEFKEKDTFVLLNEIIENLKTIAPLKAKIDHIISPTLDILDSASPNLYRIRSKILRLENSISTLSSQLVDKYRSYLSDSHSAFKNGYFTLMVKASYKNRVPGIVHAVSDTGMTVFIEPQELIEVYNNIASLKEEEIQEIQIILKDLSQVVKGYDSDLLNNIILISRLDFILAKATFAITYNGEIAKVASSYKIDFQNAAHPLIDPKKVVRNSFVITSQKMMIITGPNAGGKTVALKLVGLLVIMHQCGLALPINEGGEVSFFKNIFADIGDNQSLLDNLSTFSSHMVNVESILEKVDEDSLVIIDELGSGTSPLDGEALGLGVIDYLLNKRCFALISSHYEAIKSYALENEKICCASMVFDEVNIAPTYRLRLHTASSSYGIEVASRLGVKDEVINRAKQYIEEKKVLDKEIKLDLLNKAIEENEHIKINLKEKELELDLLKEELRNQIERNKSLRSNIIKEAELEKEKLIIKAKEEIEDIFKEFKDAENKKLHQVISAKKNIDDILSSNEEDDDEIVSLNVGDEVEIIESKIRGKVTRIKKDRVTILTDLGLSVDTKAVGIRKVTIIKKKKEKVYTPDLVSMMKRVPTECNVIGLTVKEAVEIISKYLDDCVSLHYKQVRLIHGSGTGRLRSGIHEYLKKSPYVDSYRLGGGGEGGVGATVVYLK